MRSRQSRGGREGAGRTSPPQARVTPRSWVRRGPRPGRSSRGCCGDDPTRGTRLARGAPPGAPGRAAGVSRSGSDGRGAFPPGTTAGPARPAGAAGAGARGRSARWGARAGARAARGRCLHHLRVRGAGRAGRLRTGDTGRAHRGDRAVRGLLERRPGLLVLVDPSRTTPAQAAEVARAARAAGAAGIMIGSSFDGTQDTERVARAIRQAASELPLALFPGSALQLTAEVDVVLFLSLVSGRNAQYLIEEHVRAVPFLSRHPVATLSTGYILVDGGRVTSVEAVSQPRPLPADKPEHATAARLIGMRAIYLDAGSGAPRPVAVEVIRACRAAVPDLTLFVGGGIKTAAQVRAARAAGADFVVVGTALEGPGASAADLQALVQAAVE